LFESLPGLSGESTVELLAEAPTMCGCARARRSTQPADAGYPDAQQATWSGATLKIAAARLAKAAKRQSPATAYRGLSGVTSVIANG
jgi:hypothetical protein